MARRFHNRLPGPDIATRSIRGRNRATTDPRAAIDHRSARFAGAWVGYLARGLLISLGFVVVPQPPERRRADCLWITPAARGAAPVCEHFGRAGGRLCRYPGGSENASILATVRGSMPNCRAASRRLRPWVCTA